MRKIKFRGKSLKTGEWFFGNLYDQDTHGRTHICTTHGGCLCIDPETVGQYTGLHDRRGKEIYEGDIIQFSDFRNTKPFPVRWSEINGMWILSDSQNKDEKDMRPLGEWIYRGVKIEVVGNIYDNPELVKGGAK